MNSIYQNEKTPIMSATSGRKKWIIFGVVAVLMVVVAVAVAVPLSLRSSDAADETDAMAVALKVLTEVPLVDG